MAGLYWNPANDTVRRVYVKDGKLMYQRAHGNESELAPLGGGRSLISGCATGSSCRLSRPPGAPLQLTFAEAGRKPA